MKFNIVVSGSLIVSIIVAIFGYGKLYADVGNLKSEMTSIDRIEDRIDAIYDHLIGKEND